jgi:terminase large subunit-like protein
VSQTVIELPAITAYQQSAIFCPERSAVVEATTKAGKTFGCILWLLHQALNGSAGHEFWWVAPIYEQTKIAFRRFKALLRDTDPDNLLWRANDTDPSITLSNGAVLRFKTAEKPDNLYGEDVHAAVVDEASRCKEEAWHAVRSTLTATKGRVRIIGNVKGRKNWAYHLARKVEAGNLPGWTYAKITAHDAVKAGVIGADEVEAAQRELPESVFRELYLAEPSEDGANPFGLSHIARCVGPLSTAKPEVFGVDLAKSVDFTVVVGLDAQKRPCVFERWQHLPWEATVQRIRALVGDKPALVDSTGVGDPIVETLAKEAPNIEGFKFTSTSKQQLMEGLALAIQQGEVGVLEGVMRLELEAFEYEQSRTGVKYAAPEGMHDDCVVALGLAVERARRYRPCGAIWCVPYGCEPAEPVGDIHAWYNKMREDPDWGFEPRSRSRWN